MVDLTAHQDRLVELGLTRYEAKAYLVLTHRESFTATELAAQAGIPRQRIYDVLNGLAQRGLAREFPGQVNRYSATDPRTAVDRLLAVEREALHQLQARSEDLVAALTATWTSGRGETSPLDYVEVLREPALLTERFHDLQIRANHELLIFSKPPYTVTNNIVGLEATKRIAAANGDARCVYEVSVLEDPRLLEETRQFVAAGEKARIAAEVPLKLCVTDGNRSLFSLTDPVAGGVTCTHILIEHPAIAQSLRLAFEALWSVSEPFEDAVQRSTGSSNYINGGG